MRITILSLGSRGDMQPFLALAVGLQKTGRHEVCFAAPVNFESLEEGPVSPGHISVQAQVSVTFGLK